MRREHKVVYLTEDDLRRLANPYRGWRLAIILLCAPAGFGAARLISWLLS